MEKEKMKNKQKEKVKIAEANTSETSKLVNKKTDDKSLTTKEKSATQGAGKISEKKLENCQDRNCHIHGNLKVRGRVFEGTVTKKFHKRVVIEFERMVYIRKYERYTKSKTKIHARLPDCMKDEINVGDYIKIKECRPLSKLIHFAVVEKIRGGRE